MISTHPLVTRSVVLSVLLLSRAVFAAAKSVHADPCVKVADEDSVDPVDAIACPKVIPIQRNCKSERLV